MFCVPIKVVIPAKAEIQSKAVFEKHLLLVIGHLSFSIAALNLVSNNRK
jgi:hypothetical protein